MCVIFKVVIIVVCEQSKSELQTCIMFKFVSLIMIWLGFIQANHIIFEQVGEMASSVTYLHVKMEMDLDEITEFALNYIQIIEKVLAHSETKKDEAIVFHQKRYNQVRSATYIMEEKPVLVHIANIRRMCNDRIRAAKVIISEVKSLRHTLPNPTKPTHIWQTQVETMRRKRDLSSLARNLTKQAAKAALSSASSKAYQLAKESAKAVVRQPRGMVALGLGALGTFMGLFNTYQIHNLEKEIQETQEAHNRLVEVVHQNSQHLQQMNSQLNMLTSSVEFVVQNDLAILLMGFLNIEKEIREKLEKATHVTQVAQNHRLAVDFLPADQLPDLFHKLQSQAQAIDHKLIIKQPSDLFQLELSYFYDGVRLQMLLHVPTVPKDSILRLLKLHPFPLPINKNYSIIPMVQDDLLAISAGFNRYSAQLSSVDLLGCHAINNIYLCERHGVLGKQLNNSCLGVLYLQNFQLAQEYCHLHIRPAGEVVRQLLDNWFLIYSPEPQTAYVSCRNGTENEAYIKSGITRTFLSPGCKLNLKYHLLQADFSLSLPDDIVDFKWDWDVTDIADDLEIEMNLLYEEGKTDPTLQDLFEVKKRNPKVLLFKIFVTFICSVVALGLITVIIFWYFARDYILRISCIQRFLAPKVRTLIDTTNPTQSVAMLPSSLRRSATAPTYPRINLYPHLERQLPPVPEPIYVKRLHEPIYVKRSQYA